MFLLAAVGSTSRSRAQLWRVSAHSALVPQQLAQLAAATGTRGKSQKRKGKTTGDTFLTLEQRSFYPYLAVALASILALQYGCVISALQRGCVVRPMFLGLSH